MSTTPVFLSGAALLRAIRDLNPTCTVKLLQPDETRGRLTVEQAYLVAKSGEYEGKVESGKVRYIRQIQSKPVMWSSCWRTCEAAVFPPWS